MDNSGASEMEFFVLVARHGSLAAAARALGLTPPAATKRLAQMEARLGVRLVNRTTRRLSLTGEGETYLAHATRILADIRAMEDAIAGNRAAPRGLLRVNAGLGFGRTAIAPIVSAFRNRHPQVEVQLDVTDRPVDLVDGGHDLAIRFGALPDKRLAARRLLSTRRFLYAAPRYLQQHGVPQSPADLARHRCIVHRQDAAVQGIWQFDDGAAVKVRGALSSNDGDIVLGWALDGQGILVGSAWEFASYVKSGQLRVVLAQHPLPAADLFVYCLKRKNQAARTRAFIDFLVAHVDEMA